MDGQIVNHTKRTAALIPPAPAALVGFLKRVRYSPCLRLAGNAYPIVGTIPNCCNMPSVSHTFQLSTILLSDKRLIQMPWTTAFLPVALMPPGRSAVCVPRPVHRVTTVSPSSTIISSMVQWASGNAVGRSTSVSSSHSAPDQLVDWMDHDRCG